MLQVFKVFTNKLGLTFVETNEEVTLPTVSTLSVTALVTVSTVLEEMTSEDEFAIKPLEFHVVKEGERALEDVVVHVVGRVMVNKV